MILPYDISPEKSLYIMGARIINIIQNEGHETLDPQRVYDVYVKSYASYQLTYNYFLYALDWLYILNLVDLTGNNRLKKCY